MRNTTEFTKAALLLNETQQKISEMLGVGIQLSFEVESSISITTDSIINSVAVISGISYKDITGISRVRGVVYARYACYYLMRKYLNKTYMAIGKVFKRDHASILAGCAVIENEQSNHELQELIMLSEKQFLKDIRNEN